MKGHTLTILAALLLGNGTASAAAPPTSDAPLAERLQRAQAVLERLEGLAAGPAAADKPAQLSQHWHNHHWNNWHNWHNWGNHHHH